MPPIHNAESLKRNIYSSTGEKEVSYGIETLLYCAGIPDASCEVKNRCH